MSSILKALKKVEDDKALRRQGEMKIDAEILRIDNKPRLTIAGIIVISLLLLACGSGVTYVYMKRDKEQVPSNTKQSAGTFGRKSQLPGSLSSDIKTEILPPAVVVVPTQISKNAITENFKPQKIQVSASTSRTAVVAPKVSRPTTETSKSSQRLTIPAPATSPLHSSSAKSIPVIRVNGIAFQDGSSDSVAMINGVPLSNGSMIDGVKVEEIHKNRVRFSYNGEKFEIPLGQANR